MLKILSKSIFGFSIVMLFIVTAHAADTVCPKQITSIEGDPLSDKAGAQLISIYKKLGCDLSILQRPGLRGISDFNHMRVDGELYRLKLVEPSYSRDFVRSDIPILHLRNAMWMDQRNVHKLKGFIFIPFHREIELHKAFSDGKIMGFLSEKQTVDLLMDKHAFEAYPVEAVSFGEKPLYHYLGIEFSAFMRKFSDYIKKENPYQYLN